MTNVRGHGDKDHPMILLEYVILNLLCCENYPSPLPFLRMKNSDISFQEGQIVLVQNNIAEIKEVREKTLILEMAKTKEIAELSKGKVDVVTFGTEFF